MRGPDPSRAVGMRRTCASNMRHEEELASCARSGRVWTPRIGLMYPKLLSEVIINRIVLIIGLVVHPRMRRRIYNPASLPSPVSISSRYMVLWPLSSSVPPLTPTLTTYCVFHLHNPHYFDPLHLHCSQTMAKTGAHIDHDAQALLRTLLASRVINENVYSNDVLRRAYLIPAYPLSYNSYH